MKYPKFPHSTTPLDGQAFSPSITVFVTVFSNTTVTAWGRLALQEPRPKVPRLRSKFTSKRLSFKFGCFRGDFRVRFPWQRASERGLEPRLLFPWPTGAVFSSCTIFCISRTHQVKLLDVMNIYIYITISGFQINSSALWSLGHFGMFRLFSTKIKWTLIIRRRDWSALIPSAPL